MYSAATAVLLGGFCALWFTEVLRNPDPQFGVTWSLLAAGFLAVAAICLLFLGDRPGPWPALLVVVGHAAPALLYLTVLGTPMNAVSVIIQLPVVALYLGGFTAPLLARVTQAIVLTAITVIIVVDPFEVVHELNGGKSMPSMVIFTWLCLEAGIFVQKRFKQETHVDSLTGLYNRRGFVAHADLERSRADRNGTPLCLVMIDLDGFKRVNDTQGHHMGDRLLRDLAGDWKAAARGSDVLCRVGGDEFIFVLPDTNVAAARMFLTRIGERPRQPWSYGIIEWESSEILAAVILKADEAMYLQKAEKYARAAVETEGGVATLE